MAGEFQKISGPFRRAEDLHHVDRTRWVNESVRLLAAAPVWEYTEKIDGTNVRIHWDGFRLTYAGRTDRAELHPRLVEKLDAYFKRPGVEEWFEEHFPADFEMDFYPDVTLFGEGYGAGIQKAGESYAPTRDFVGFDISVGHRYLSRANSRDIFAKLGVPFLVPLNDEPATLFEPIAAVTAGLKSGYGDFMAEGVVATTIEPLYDQRGERLVVKIKHADLFA